MILWRKIVQIHMMAGRLNVIFKFKKFLNQNLLQKHSFLMVCLSTLNNFCEINRLK